MSTSLTRVLRDQLCVAAPAAPQRSLNAAASGRSALAAALRRPSDTVAAARRSAATTRWLRRPAAASGEPSSSPSALQQAALRLAAGLAAAVLIAQPASAAASGPPVVLNAAQTAAEEQGTEYMYQGKLLFDPMAYSGRWYEVASLKKGFAGEGQADCHCTQGIYVPQEGSAGLKLQVNTFCVHGGPGGRLSGIQGSVSCANPVLLEVLPEFKSAQEVADGIVSKCLLTFDSLPFIPPEPYNVIRTDYTTYALVQGAKDRSFVQVYSRLPNPGPAFIAEKKAVLASIGYPVDEIVDTPQDCPEMAPAAMMGAMDRGMAGRDLMPAGTPPQRAMAGYDLGPASEVVGAGASPVQGIAFDGFRNPLESVKNVLRLLQQ